MGVAGRQWILERWRWQTHAARLAALLTG